MILTVFLLWLVVKLVNITSLFFHCYIYVTAVFLLLCWKQLKSVTSLDVGQFIVTFIVAHLY